MSTDRRQAGRAIHGARNDRPRADAKALARSIIDGQSAELTQMKAILGSG